MTKIIGAPTLFDALSALSQEIAKSEEQGVKNLIFCEDRLTLLAEHAVLEKTGGTFLTEVTTFARFLSGGATLSKQGSVMALAALIADNGEKLRCFSPEAAGAVYETIAQLSASRVTAEDLRRSAEETGDVLGMKLADLALLLEGYRSFLSERGLTDENGYLALLPDKIKAETGGTHVFFFAFSSFTAQAREGIRAAIGSARDVTGIFIAGKEELYTNEGARSFRRAAEEISDVTLRMTACSLQGEALRLQQCLFSPEKLKGTPDRAERIRIFFAEDETEELCVVAALVRKYVAEGLRYRDFAVLVPDGKSFTAVEKAFGEYKIPFYADKKRKFSEHPFCAFVLAAIDAVASGSLPEEIDAVAANVCFGDGDAYRNYLAKYAGFRGGAARQIKEGEAVKGYDRESLLACREKMLKILSFFPRKGRGRTYAEGVSALAEYIGWEEIGKKISSLGCTKEEKRFLDLAPLQGALNEILSVAGGRTFTVREFRKFLQSGLDALEISMIPQSADCVFVGDATESRLVRFKVVFVTGLTDDLPRVAQDTAVITDGEIGRLKTLGTEIEPAIAEVNARARESLALNLCAFEEALFLSCPKKLRGEDTVRGEILQYAEKIYRPAPMPEIFPYNCCEKGPAAANMLAWKEDFERGRSQDGTRFSSVAAALRGTGEGELVDFLLGGGEKPAVPEAEKLYFANGNLSPTLLEAYFSCPYSGFASRGLKLREREERTVLDTDAGTFVHAVLEEVAKRLNGIESEEECRKIAAETGKALLSTPKFSSLCDTPAGSYTADRLVSEGAEVSAAAYRQLALSSFRVRETEEGIFLPELSIAGKADRVDEADGLVRVIDYKTGSIDDSPVGYYTGRKLQLQLYLLAAARGGQAAGAFYFPAAESYTPADETKYRMRGFFCGESEVVSRMDVTLSEGEKSSLFEGGLTGKFTDRGMSREDFSAFLDYAALVCARAEEEMREGNVSPSPYEGVCAYCKMKSLCAFTGEERKEKPVTCAQIAAIAKKCGEERE